ncbi:hypothetical protein FH972_023445 [Carpinus fangiana]|uniref:Protein kinase domain-containing protein n=1 Tax=Carpinus fangiana TaxID=176857 RepID=A0A5N6KVP3_9ROSI|nr:hypothetical protein FH972_023445 [Carpinus fangiana]
MYKCKIVCIHVQKICERYEKYESLKCDVKNRSRVDIGLAVRRQLPTRDQAALSRPEVSVALNIVLAVQPRQRLLEESVDLVVGAARAKLGQPDGLAELLVGAGDVALEVCEVGGRVVPVDGDGVDGAAAAGVDEVAQPGQAHRRGAVGDCGRDERGLPGVGLHVLLPHRHGVGHGHVALVGEVGLVEAEQTTPRLPALWRAWIDWVGAARAAEARRHSRPYLVVMEAIAIGAECYDLTICKAVLRVILLARLSIEAGGVHWQTDASTPRGFRTIYSEAHHGGCFISIACTITRPLKVHCEVALGAESGRKRAASASAPGRKQQDSHNTHVAVRGAFVYLSMAPPEVEQGRILVVFAVVWNVPQPDAWAKHAASKSGAGYRGNEQARKVIVKTAPLHRLDNERHVLHKLSKQASVRQLIDQVSDPPALILEHLDSNLLEESNKSTLTRPEIKTVAQTALQALVALHDAGYVHTEAMLNLKWGTATDIWSLGTTCRKLISLIWGRGWHIFKPEVPFDDETYSMRIFMRHDKYFGPFPLSYLDIADEESLGILAGITKACDRRAPFAMALSDEISPEDRTFILKMMKLDPRDRPTAQSLLEDEWFKVV